MFEGKIVAGSYVGTGAPLAVTVGFQPKVVLVVNTDDADECFLHFAGMAAEHGVLLASGAYGDNQGVTLSARGFSPAAELSVNTEDYLFIAIG